MARNFSSTYAPRVFNDITYKNIFDIDIYKLLSHFVKILELGYKKGTLLRGSKDKHN